MEPILVVGCGPGDPGYVLPVATAAAQSADVLFGVRRCLDLFATCQGDSRVLAGPTERSLAAIESARADGNTVAVLVTGDPNLFSYLGVLRRRFAIDELVVVPGVSSVQVAAARTRLSVSEAEVVSVHGRPLDGLEAPLESRRRLFVLTDASNDPRTVVEYVLRIDDGRHRRFWICEELTLPTERVTGPLSDVASVPDGCSALSVVVITEDE